MKGLNCQNSKKKYVVLLFGKRKRDNPIYFFLEFDENKKYKYFFRMWQIRHMSLSFLGISVLGICSNAGKHVLQL